MANVIKVNRRKDTATVVNFPGYNAASKITTGLAYTITKSCVGTNTGTTMGAVADAVNTAVVEDAATGMYNFSIAAVDLTAEKNIYKLAANLTNEDVVVIVETAQYMSYLDITSMTAAQHALKLAGNTTGAGAFVVGGATGDGMQISDTGQAYAVKSAALSILGKPTASVGIYSNGYQGAWIDAGASGGTGMLIGHGGSTDGTIYIANRATASPGPGAAIYAVGGASSTAAGNPAVTLTGGASTWANVGGKGGSAIAATTGASNANATSWNPTVSATAVGTNANAVALTATGTGYAIDCIGGGLDPTLISSLFTVDSGSTYASAVAGSLVKEISILSGDMADIQVDNEKFIVYSGTKAADATTDSTAVLLPKSMRPSHMYLDVTVNTAGTCAVLFQDSIDGTNFVTQGTFTTVTSAASHQRILLPGSVQRYARAEITVGSGGSYTIELGIVGHQTCTKGV
jgi:hypothetical protein